jgi:predicted SAM-dependent methyltransferase
MRSFLHIGCGPKRKSQTTRGFNSDLWSEIRFDIDSSVQADLLGTITDMSAVGSSTMQAIFSSHNIEHLYPHEVPVALSEFLRVLSDDGFAVITCPDLQSVSALIAESKLTEPAYQSPAGPITPLDILYGHRPAMARGNLYMAHRCGFTQKVLQSTLTQAGFKSVATLARGRAPFFDLWALASKSVRSIPEMRELAKIHFPVQ